MFVDFIIIPNFIFVFSFHTQIPEGYHHQLLLYFNLKNKKQKITKSKNDIKLILGKTQK